MNDRLNLLLDLGRWKDAEALAREAIAADPEWAAAYSHLARALLGQGRTLDAERAARDGVRKDPRDAWAHLVLGWTHARRDRLRDARRAADEALRLHPEFVAAYALRAHVFARRDDHRQARSAALDGLRLDPTSRPLLTAKGWAEFHLGRLPAAAKTAESALAQHPTADELHNLLGCVLWAQAEQAGWGARLGLHKRADRHLAEAVRLDPAEGYQENLRNAALATRQHALRFLWWAACGASLGLSAPAVVWAKGYVLPAAGLWLLGTLTWLQHLQDGTKPFVLAAPLRRLGVPEVPLTPAERRRGRRWWAFVLGCLALAPVAAWAAAAFMAVGR